MAEKFSWNYVAQALNGPSLSGQGELTVDAYDKIEVTIAASAVPHLYFMLPGAWVQITLVAWATGVSSQSMSGVERFLRPASMTGGGPHWDPCNAPGIERSIRHQPPDSVASADESGGPFHSARVPMRRRGRMCHLAGSRPGRGRAGRTGPGCTHPRPIGRQAGAIGEGSLRGKHQQVHLGHRVSGNRDPD